jgi:EmrB/QacA subfamily drug resistance transporter
MQRLERKWWALILVCTAVFMLLLDITVVNVALPDMQRDLDASFSQLQWVIDAYALALATLVLTAGSLADLRGRKAVFVVGLAVFSAASAACGAAPTAGFLIAARAAQGLGGAIMFATSLALIAAVFHGRERGVAFGIWGATIGAAAAIGPLVGGILTEGLGWRWIFFVNVPIGAAAFVLALRELDESRDPSRKRVDVWGTAALTGALFLLVYGLLQGNSSGWSSALIVGCLTGAVVLGVVFVVVELTSSDPMLDVRLFGGAGFTGAQICAFALSCAMFSIFLYLTLYLQNVLGFGPLAAGLRFLPLSLASFAAAVITGNLTGRIRVSWLLGVGLLVCGVSLLLMARVSTDSSWTVLVPGFILGGIGIGIVNPALATAAVGVVPPARSGMASGTNNTFRQVGIATGVAAFGALFEGRISDHVAAATGTTPAHGLVARIASGSFPPQIEAASREAFVSGLHSLLVAAAVIAFVGAVLSVVLVRGFRIQQHAPAPAGVTPEPSVETSGD